MDPTASDQGGGPLPNVIVTSVIRSANQGDSHGGVHLLDLERSTHRQVIDWDEGDIDWEGRGGDRGLRGVAFWHDEVYLAASDEVFVYTPSFERLRSFSNPYLKHCHEIDVVGDRLLLSSCGFDSILVYDLLGRQFESGYLIRNRPIQDRLDRGLRLASRGRIRRAPHLRPSFARFDPRGPDGPIAGDHSHINSVTGQGDAIHLSGTKFNALYRIQDDRLSVVAEIPYGTHNARPWHDGLLYNDTANDLVCHRPALAGPAHCVDVPTYDESALRQVDKAEGNARQGFGRGLAVWQDRYLITGSSPATVRVYDLRRRCTVRQINLSMDVRNAIHGLEVWPFPGV